VADRPVITCTGGAVDQWRKSTLSSIFPEQSCAVTICHRTRPARPFDVPVHLISKYRAIASRIQAASMTISITPTERKHSSCSRACVNYSQLISISFPLTPFWSSSTNGCMACRDSDHAAWTAMDSPAPQSLVANFPKTSPDDITDSLAKTVASLPLMHVAFPNISITPKCLASDLWRPGGTRLHSQLKSRRV